MERKAEVERMLSAAAAKKEFAVSEAELMAGEEKAMLMAEQAQTSTPPKVAYIQIIVVEIPINYHAKSH